MKTITVSTVIDASVEKVWTYWTEPRYIEKWNAASENWESVNALNDLRVGGKFSCRMQAKDGSAGFDFGGVYTALKKYELIAYTMSDGRKVTVQFTKDSNGVLVREVFDMETVNSEELQRKGWQAILNNFRRHVENS